MKKILITTKHKGVFFGQVSQDADLTTETIHDIKRPVMVIRWRTGEGVLGLTNDFNSNDVLLSKEGDSITTLHGVTMVVGVSEAAAAKVWEG